MQTAGQEKASSLITSLPEYSQIGMDSPEVKAISDTLDANTVSDAKEAFANDRQTTIAGKEQGSSYKAMRDAKLGDLISQQLQKNKLTALSTAQQNQASNTSNASNLYQILQAAGTSPTASYNPASYIGMGQNAYNYYTPQKDNTLGQILSAVS